MKIAVIGAGYVGLTTAACLCELGHTVWLVEIDPVRLGAISAGRCPIYEPGLPELLTRHLGGALHATSDLMDALKQAEVAFICVGTPPRASGAPDLSALRHLLMQLRRLKTAGTRPVVVLKSTVPPGTNRWASQMLGGAFAVVSNPEFLREGTAIADFFHPDRVVIGTEDQSAGALVASLYDSIEAPLVTTGWEQAELVKYATNAFLAMKISFANEMAALCDGIRTDCTDVLKGLGLDQRVGNRFLSPGPGYGGSCLPKDLQALAWAARKASVRLDLLPAAERANRRQRERLLTKLVRGLRGLEGRTVAVWGLAFKAGTDDCRSSASLDLVPGLLKRGARVQAHDPAARETFARACPQAEHPGLTLLETAEAALHKADALLILTEWEEYRQFTPAAIARPMSGTLVVDGRNLLDPGAVRAEGLRYTGVGRGGWAP